MNGRCTCGRVQYRLRAELETEHLEVLGDPPVTIDTPSNSGKGQKIVRCPTCHVALYSHYAGMGDILAFVRVGTLEEAGSLAPDVHIFTACKQPWVVLPPDVPAFAEYYNAKEVWKPESLKRREHLLARRGR